MNEAVIVEALRVPAGKEDGQLSEVRPDHLGAYLVDQLVKKLELDPAELDDVLFGCVDQVGEQALNIGRNVLIAAGLPKEVPGCTIDRQCGSSQTAINLAATRIQAGVNDVVLAGGVESMSRVPMGGNTEIYGEPFGRKWNERFQPVPQGISAEMIADEWSISRETLDDFAFRSHERARKAIRNKFFDNETVPVPVQNLEEDAEQIQFPERFAPRDPGNEEWFSTDEGVRMNPDREAMGNLDPVFREDGRITAGNSSQISDGASAVLVMSERKASALGYTPRARIAGQKTVGVDPTIMLTGPIPATDQLLDDQGMSIQDVDLFEVNEAFTSVPIAWKRELEPEMDKVNVNGGAIALGHPLGATGGKLMTTLVHELERRDQRFGLQTMCCGGGLGVATLIDRKLD